MLVTLHSHVVQQFMEACTGEELWSQIIYTVRVLKMEHLWDIKSVPYLEVKMHV